MCVCVCACLLRRSHVLGSYDVLAHVLRTKAVSGLVDKSTLLVRAPRVPWFHHCCTSLRIDLSPLCVCALFSQLLFAMAGMRDVAVMVENESHSPVHSSQRRHLADIVSDATRAASRLETG